MYTVKKFKQGALIKKVGRVSAYAKTTFWAVMDEAGNIRKDEAGNEDRFNLKHVAETQCDYLNAE